MSERGAVIGMRLWMQLSFDGILTPPYQIQYRSKLCNSVSIPWFSTATYNVNIKRTRQIQSWGQMPCSWLFTVLVTTQIRLIGSVVPIVRALWPAKGIIQQTTLVSYHDCRSHATFSEFQRLFSARHGNATPNGSPDLVRTRMHGEDIVLYLLRFAFKKHYKLNIIIAMLYNWARLR